MSRPSLSKEEEERRREVHALGLTDRESGDKLGITGQAYSQWRISRHLAPKGMARHGIKTTNLLGDLDRIQKRLRVVLDELWALRKENAHLRDKLRDLGYLQPRRRPVHSIVCPRCGRSIRTSKENPRSAIYSHIRNAHGFELSQREISLLADQAMETTQDVQEIMIRST